MGGLAGVHHDVIDFSGNGSTDYFTVADHADFTLPNSDWCWGLWANWPSAPTGSAFHYMVSNNSFGATNSLQIYITEDSGSPANSFFYHTLNSASTLYQDSVTVTDINNGSPWLIVVQRRSGNISVRVAQPGDSSVTASANTSITGTVDSANATNIGRRQDGDANRYMQGEMGELFKGNFSLQDADIVALANGASILEFGYPLDFYWPAYEDTAANQKDWIGGKTITRNGTPATANHAPVLPYSPRTYFLPAVAGGGATIPFPVRRKFAPLLAR